jgi:hypothetical protein
LETILINQGIDLEQTGNNPQTPDLTNLTTALETFSDNLSLIQEEDTDEEGNIVPKQIFSLSGDLIVERLKAQKIEAEEIEVAGVKAEQIKFKQEDIDRKQGDEEDDQSSVGRVVIPAGKKSVTVSSGIVEEFSKIILTSRDKPIAVGVGEIKEGKSFEVKIANVLDDDLTVDWIIIGVSE